MTAEQLQNFQYVWLGFSLAAFVEWLCRTRAGRTALPRHDTIPHRLTPVDLFCIALVYLGVSILSSLFLQEQDQLSLQPAHFYLAIAAGQIIVTVVALSYALSRFPNFQTFGLTLRPFKKIALWTLPYFIVAAGLTWFVLHLTQVISQAFGYEQIQSHEFLQAFDNDPSIFVQIIIVASSAILAPLTEEILFRGIIQNFLIKLLSSPRPASTTQAPSDDHPFTAPTTPPTYHPWLAIIITSIAFALLHGNWQHWPALIVLSTVLGYCYQKQRNLLIPIIIHALFNTIVVILKALTEL